MPVSLRGDERERGSARAWENVAVERRERKSTITAAPLSLFSASELQHRKGGIVKKYNALGFQRGFNRRQARMCARSRNEFDLVDGETLTFAQRARSRGVHPSKVRPFLTCAPETMRHT